MVSRFLWYNPAVDKDPELDKGNYAKQSFGLANKDTANLIGSLGDAGYHYPVIDLDVPCKLVESSTPGHYHLYIDKGISWSSYKNLLNGFRLAGLIESGWFNNATQAMCSFVRPPWLKKGEKPAKAWSPPNFSTMTKEQVDEIKQMIGYGLKWVPKAPFHEYDSPYNPPVTIFGPEKYYMDGEGWLMTPSIMYWHGYEIDPDTKTITKMDVAPCDQPKKKKAGK